MSRAGRKPGAHHRVRKPMIGDAQRHWRDAKRRVEERDGCRFPGACTCPQCDPEADA